MSADIKIPKLGMSMTEGTLTEWLVPDGAVIQEGTPIYALESDKSTQEVEAANSGTLRIIGKSGETYQVGDVIGTIE